MATGDRPIHGAPGGCPDAPGGGVPEAGWGGDGDQLARVLETMPAAFCFFDPEWRFRYVNAQAEELLGRARAELLGRTLWEALRGIGGTAHEAGYRSAVESGEAVAFEGAHPDAGTGWFEVRAWPSPDGLAVYYLDVSARRRAEELVDRGAARTALLTQVNAELSAALDSEQALGRLARLVVPTLTDACIVTVVDRGGRARDVGSWHADPARRAALARYTEVRLETLPADSPVARALEAGTPLTESIDAVLGMMRPGPARDLLRELGPATAVVLPLPAESRTVGVLTLYQDAGRQTSQADVETARLVAVQAGRAVERVHRQSEQVKLAEGLQRSLLTEPPEIEGAQIVARYVPAAEAARIGGDWYDAFRQRDGAPVVVIGDVVGHDTAAAAAMGQLRGLLRGIAHHSGAGPAEILRGLDEAIGQMHADTMATATIARLERADPSGDAQCNGQAAWSRLRWANAGHPPPMLLGPDGSVTPLGGLAGELMLGVDASVERHESVVDLVPGATVLLYTDGLVERRTSTLDAGLDRLADELRALAGRPLAALCDALIHRMLDRTPQDDVAVIAVRLAAASGTAPGG